MSDAAAPALPPEAPPVEAEARDDRRLWLEPAPDVCPNCGARARDRFCPSCGQHQMRGRLTLRRLWTEFASRVFNLNRGLLATVVGMSRQPGRVPLDYVEGRRRRYTNPLTYLLLASALSLFMLRFSEDAMREQYRGQIEAMEADRAAERGDTGVPHDHDGDGIRDHDPDEFERFGENLEALMADGGTLFTERIMGAMKRYQTWFMTFLCLPLTLSLRLLFGPSRHLPEVAVFSLYVVAHSVAVSALVLPFLVPLGQAATMSGVLVYVALAAWGAVEFWGEGWSAAARAAAAMVASYAVYILFVVVIVIAMIFGEEMADAGLTWGQFLGRVLD